MLEINFKTKRDEKSNADNERLNLNPCSKQPSAPLASKTVAGREGQLCSIR